MDPQFENTLITNELDRSRQLKEDLRRSNENLRQFAMIVSHDLQRPLKTLAFDVRTLEMNLGSEPESGISCTIRNVKASIDEMGKMISDLLRYSWFTHGDMYWATIDLEQVVRWVLANLQDIVRANQAVITHDALPLIRGDFARLAQLFQNLIENSIKYRSPEPPCIHISAERNADYWILSVSDNGIGIDPIYCNRIFGIFQRLHGPEYPGMGIGLSICKSIVELGGGRIWVESKPGEGAIFQFTWPVATDADRA
jgi:chemotaxis family two-component system sensor kinase Cph1